MLIPGGSIRGTGSWGRCLEIGQRSHDEDRVRQLLAKGLAVAGLPLEEGLGLPGAEPRKVAIAQMIWEQTTVSPGGRRSIYGWVAQQM